jgi:hypothetical protein
MTFKALIPSTAKARLKGTTQASRMALALGLMARSGLAVVVLVRLARAAPAIRV